MDPQQLPLKPIHAGTEITNWPIAPGWWILAALIIICTILVLYKWRAARQRNKAKLVTLAELQRIETDYATQQNHKQMLDQCAHILKRFLLAYYPRSSIAKLHGEGLRTFLAAHVQDKPDLKSKILGDTGKVLTEGRYQPRVEANVEVLQMVQQWVKQFPTKVQQQNKLELPHARV